MYLARICNGVAQPIVYVDDFESDLVDGREVRRPRQPWARLTPTGAAALSQSPEGALASARAVLQSPEDDSLEDGD